MFTLINDNEKQEFENIYDAIDAGKAAGQPFIIGYGRMVCCAWYPDFGLEYTTEYMQWYQDQQQELARVGDYE